MLSEVNELRGWIDYSYKIIEHLWFFNFKTRLCNLFVFPIYFFLKISMISQCNSSQSENLIIKPILLNYYLTIFELILLNHYILMIHILQNPEPLYRYSLNSKLNHELILFSDLLPKQYIKYYIFVGHPSFFSKYLFIYFFYWQDILTLMTKR
jgi:hypothetical protein